MTPDEEAVPALAGSPGAALIDVRAPVGYAEVHAEGAQLFPLDVLDSEAAMSERDAPPDEPVYVLCKSGSRAAKAVDRFRAAGYENVLSVEGGTGAWERAHPAFFGLSAFVWIGLVFAGVADWCGMGLLLAKLPCNRRGREGDTCSR